MLLLTSCAQKKDVVYYGYFTDSAIMVVYSQQKNTLYEINVPMSLITSWAAVNGESGVMDAMRSLAGLNEDGFMTGSPQVLTALREILDALSPGTTGEPTSQSRMETIVSKSYLLKNASLMNNINRLCQTDLGALADAITVNSPKVTCLDAEAFLNENDMEFSRKYFRSWLYQVIN